MNKVSSTEYFGKLIFETKSKSSSYYYLILVWLLLILLMVILSSNDSVMMTLISAIIVGSLFYFYEALQLSQFSIYEHSIKIRYPYVPYRKEISIHLNSIKKILFDDSSNYGYTRWSWSEMILFYQTDNGVEKKKGFQYKLDEGDLRGMVCKLRDIGLNVEGAEKYFGVT